MSKTKPTKGINIEMAFTAIETEEALKRKLAKLDEQRRNPYNPELYAKGQEWAIQGMNLEDAGELAQNKSFQNGYARGQRLLKIQAMDEIGNNQPKRR